MHQTIIYDPEGTPVGEIQVDDEILSMDGRVSKGKKAWYKGIGSEYHSHFTDSPGPHHQILEKMDVFYLGWSVINPFFSGKTGIFQERYQPQFTDWIGGCGVKELSIIENSRFFEKSSVEVIKSHKVSNDQYWFELNYSCGRRKYPENGFPKKLYELLHYMVQEHWNFPWEKDSITDVSYNGLVTDVADLFYSKERDHKLGTVYSVLYSLGQTEPKAYEKFLKSARMKHSDLRSYIYNSVELLKRFGVDITEYQKPYDQILRENLLTGRNCGHCVLDGIGEQIKEAYLQGI